jgi:polyisoprenoid-binding protein YceI
MLLRAAALATLLALAPVSARAEWALDPSHTHVGFTVNHLGFSDVTGMFRAVDAEVRFDPQDLAATEVTVTIDAASVDTFWAIRDEAIRSGDFLDVANHPEIRFVTTAVTPTGDGTATVTGDLTLRGVTTR